MRTSVGLMGLLLMVAPVVLAQDDNNNLPDLATLSQPDGQAATTAAETTETKAATTAASDSKTTDATTTAARTTNTEFPDVTSIFKPVGLPTLAGVGIPNQQVPDTSGAAFMQKSGLPEGTVFICVGAILAFFGAAVLAWRGLVAWSLARSVKRAASAQNLSDVKSMSALPGGKKRGMYNQVGANSTMSLDQLSAAPISKTSKPFTGPPGSMPQRTPSSLFFSPTAGGAAGMRESVANRSSTYLPAGYYASGNAAPAAGSSQTYIGGQNPNNLSAHSLNQPGNRFSARSGISPPESPSLPPAHGGYARAPPSRDGLSVYNRNSVATLSRSPVYGQGNDNNPSQLSLNVPGGTNVPGGRAPSAYLEDLFENHGNGPRERY